MVRGKSEYEGDLAAWTLFHIRQRVWGTDQTELDDLNPARPPAPVSEALREHLAREQARRLRLRGT